jgi:hypothetical protein
VVNAYVSLVYPHAEMAHKALSLRLTQVGAIDGLTGEWQASTRQLVQCLQSQVNDVGRECCVSSLARRFPGSLRVVRLAGAVELSV